MKFKNIIYLLGACLLLNSCTLDKPEIPSEELFLRNFIKRFGLIDPNQDWNLAERASITVNMPRYAENVVIYAEIFDDYYRVARSHNVAAGVNVFPLDIPINTTSIAIEVDGVPYITEVNGTIDLSTAIPAEVRESRADPVWLNEDNVLGWVILCEDLGSTDDVDFNDVVFRMEYEQTGYYAMGAVTPKDWDVIQQETGDLRFDPATGSIVLSRDGENLAARGTNEITVKALAAGGVLKSWLHYRSTATGNPDYIVSPKATAGKKLTSEIGDSEADTYEWHRWFGSYSDGVMINTACNIYNGAGGNNHDGTNSTDYTNDAYIKDPVYGSRTNVVVDEGFSFATYSQISYSDGDPITSGNFSFDKHTINGFYITVNNYDENNIDTSNDGKYSYNMTHVIGHNRGQGLPPQMFLVPDLCQLKPGATGDVGTEQAHFRWPTERTQIDNAYTQFDNWVNQGTGTWYRYGRQDFVVSDAFIGTIYGGDDNN